MSLTLLMLPGLHGGSKLFERFLASLPDWITPRVVSYPADRIVTYDEIIASIELPTEPFALLAESYAGPLGIRIAAAQPQNLRALVLVATFARSPHPYVPRWATGVFQSWMFGLPIQRNACRRVLLRDDGTREQLDEGWAELFLVNPTVLAARVREVLRVDVRDHLQQIRVPTLYLRASRDVVVPARATRDIQQQIPGMKIVTLDTAHPVLQRRPAKSATAVAEFLERAATAKPQA